MGEMKPREGLVEIVKKGRGKGQYMLTGLGLAHVQQMAALGCGKTEIAEYLKVHHSWMGRACDPENDYYDPQVHEAFVDGESEFKQRLRRHQIELSEHNATMAVHLGKQYLGQKDQVQEHHHLHQVVGTMPDYEQSSEDWKKQFGPSALQQIEDKAEDAVVIDLEANATGADQENEYATSERDEESN